MQKRSESARSRGKRTSGMDRQPLSPRLHRDMLQLQLQHLQVGLDTVTIPPERISSPPLALKEASPQCSLSQVDTAECRPEWPLPFPHQAWLLHHHSLVSSLHLDITLACQCHQVWPRLQVWHHLLVWHRHQA
jgi:hypothetical protein